MFDERAIAGADEAAKAILAACMMDSAAAETAINLLEPDDFLTATDGGDTLAAIFAAVSSLVQKRKRPIPVLVDSELKTLGLGPKREDGAHISMVAALTEHARVHITGTNVEDLAEVLRLQGLRRRLNMAGAKIRDIAHQEGLSAADYVAQVEAVLTEASQIKGVGGDGRRLGDVVEEQIRTLRAIKQGEFRGLKTGLRDLDALVRGLKPGDMVTVAARPSIGKTAFTLNISNNVAKAGGGVAFFSLEMSAEQMANRTIAAEGGVNAGLAEAGLIQPAHWDIAYERVKASGIMAANVQIYVGAHTVAEMRATVLRQRRSHSVDMIVVDYIQNMHGTSAYARSGNRVQEMSEISRQIKALARELGCPIIAVSQLSREVERRQNKRPLLSDLRETGSIEQDSDIVMLLFRQDYYDEQEGKTPEKPGVAEVIVAKHRNGSTGSVEVEFIKERQLFVARK